MINLKFKDYLKLNDVSDYLTLQHLKPSNNLKWFTGKSIKSLKYSDIMVLKRFTGDYDSLVTMFSLVFGMTEINLLNLHIIDMYKGLNYFYKEIDDLVKFENNYLSFRETKESILWKDAQAIMDVDLSKHGDYGIIESLCREYNYSFKEISEMSYMFVLKMIKYKNDKAIVEKKFNELLMPKS